jgi:8-oxo-dGTP pyrophosphatase MutT (NUDIX family)
MNEHARPQDPVDTAPPRPAASLVLLRDDPAGLRVLLLERPSEDRVLAGARVFPGGKLDREDADEPLLARFDVPSDALHARLGEPELDAREAAALFVAAVREAFEETGVLLARDVDEARAASARALRREGFGFGEVLERLDVSLDASLMQPWSRWVTPKVPSQMRRRFDTRFFVARLPEGQVAVHDPSEAVAADWMGPREAIERYWAGEIDMAAPQIMTLAHLSRFADVGEALADAAARVPPVIRPQPYETPTGRLLCYPGDPKHPVAARAMPGPTRLLFEQGRFRPECGRLDAWFE